MIKEVRGRGLMIAIEFNHITICQAVFRELFKKRHLVAYGSTFIRIDPPLIIHKTEVCNFLFALDNILNRLPSPRR